MATLYRCSAPTDRLCPCGRVARALRRQDIPYAEVVMPQRRAAREEVEALSGQRKVPLLVIDGQVICDSHRILEYLEHRSEPRAVPGSPRWSPAGPPRGR